jgi:hypothetical protein
MSVTSPMDFSVSTSPNGWTDDFLCTEWFKKSFIPQATARNKSGKPILLVYDGHGSHDTSELCRLARDNNIILFCLPPHTTHKLQPLDVGVFGPFQRGWIDRCDEIVEDTGEEMPREDFIREYMAIRRAKFKPTTIISAFRKSGIRPLNPDIFTDEDYAPSIPTSTAAHVPSSYPTQRLSAMPISAVFGDWEDDESAIDSDSSDEDYEDSDDESSNDSDDEDDNDNGNDNNDINDSENEDQQDHPPTTPSAGHHAHTTSRDETPPAEPYAVVQVIRNHLPRQGEDPGQGEYPTQPTTSNLREAPARERPHVVGLQHPEGVHPPSSSPSTLAASSIPSASFYSTTRRSSRTAFAAAQASVITVSSAGSKKDQQAQIAKLISQNEALASRVTFLEAHCALAVSEIRDLKWRMNARNTKTKKKKKLNVLARCLNSDEGLDACDQRDEEDRQKQARKEESAARKLAKEQERERARAARGPVEAYMGSLASKSKPDLQEIAEALALPKDGTKQDLQTRINAHFDAHPRFKEDPKYIGLFIRTRGQKRPAQAISNDQNSPPDERNYPPFNRLRYDPAPGPSTSTMPRSFSRDLSNSAPQLYDPPPLPHPMYHTHPFVPNHNHHPDYGPFRGPPAQYIPPHMISEGAHHQHPAVHNSYTNPTFSVDNRYLHPHPSS